MRGFVVLAVRSEAPALRGTRLGVTVSRRVGGAVVRNRVKRRIRVWFRHAREKLAPGLDLVVIARRAAAELDSSAMEAELREAAQRAGALAP